VAKDELVEVDLKVVLRDAPMRALKPGLEVGDGAVCARQEELAVGVAPALVDRPVVVGTSRVSVSGPAVGVDDRAALDVGAQEVLQGGGGGVGRGA